MGRRGRSGGMSHQVASEVGAYGERLAARYLAEAGLEVLERNWRCAQGEIDIVALDGDCLVVCEVKTRRGSSFGDPVEAVTWRKAARLRRLAACWLAEHPGRVSDVADVRVDVVGVLRPRSGPAQAGAPRGGGDVKLGRTRSVALAGLEGALVDVEADLVQGLPQFLISGLPDAACKQSPDRIKAAAANSGVPVPNRRWTVNLSPASMPKGGSGFDLPIAVAVLAAAGLVPAQRGGADGAHRRAGAGRLGAAGARGAAGRAGRGPARRDVAWSCRPTTRPRRRSCPGCGCCPRGTCPSWFAATACWARAGCRRTSRSWQRRSASRSAVPDLRDVVGPGRGAAGARDRGGGRAPPVHGRPAGRRQDDAGRAAARAAAGAGARARPGGHGDPVAAGRAAAVRGAGVPPTVRRAAPRRLDGGDHRRRQRLHPPRRDLPGPPRRAVPRRGAGVQAVGAAGAAAAGRVRRGDDRPRVRRGPLPGPVPARARRQPVPVRPRVRQGGRLLLLADGRAATTWASWSGPLLDRVDLQLQVHAGQPGRAGRSPPGRRARSWPPGCCGTRGAGRAAGRHPVAGQRRGARADDAPQRLPAAASRRPSTSTGRSSGARSRCGATTGCSSWRGPCATSTAAGTPTRSDVGLALTLRARAAVAA